MASNTSMYYGLAAVAALAGIGVYAATSKPATTAPGYRPRPPAMIPTLPQVRLAYADVTASTTAPASDPNGFIGDPSLVTAQDQTVLLNTPASFYAAYPGITGPAATALIGYLNMIGLNTTRPPWLSYAISQIVASGLPTALSAYAHIVTQPAAPGVARPRTLGKPLVPGPARRFQPVRARARFAATQAYAGRATGLPY